jgi:hypothetical protein
MLCPLQHAHRVSEGTTSEGRRVYSGAWHTLRLSFAVPYSSIFEG